MKKPCLPETMQLDNNKILLANDLKFETNTGNFPRVISRNRRPDSKQTYVSGTNKNVAILRND